MRLHQDPPMPEIPIYVQGNNFRNKGRRVEWRNLENGLEFSPMS
jgi:hypothetical protein